LSHPPSDDFGEPPENGGWNWSDSELLEVSERVTRALRSSGTRNDSEDVVQTALTDLFADTRAGKAPRPDSLIAWVRKVAHFRLSKLRDKERRAPEYRLHRPAEAPEPPLEAHADDAPQPQESASRTELALLLDGALRELSPQDRELFLLHHLDGLTHAELGARMGKTEAAMRAWVHRIRTRLRQSGGLRDYALPRRPKKMARERTTLRPPMPQAE